MTTRPPSPRYQRVLECVTTQPERATAIYRRWNDLPEWKSLTTRHRNELKWLGHALENLAADGHIIRETGEGGITFRRKREIRGPTPTEIVTDEAVTLPRPSAA